MKKITLILITVLFLFLHFRYKPAAINSIVHIQWTALLKKHVNNNGDVNYKGFIKDSLKLNKYLNLLSNNAPDSLWSKNEQFAYWINAYNAFTVKLIIQNYPLKSIKDLGSTATNNSPWDKKFFTIGGKQMTLNIIEHEILRKQFNDPRLHFAINCASYSCPKLLNKAFESSRLDAQLNERAKDFMNDTSKNILAKKNARLSSILLWYGTDFTKTGVSKIEYINRFSKIKIDTTANVTYLKYNWALNEQK
ncbi:MAG: DUF547 domain-containing protein [Ferruginibacter sp.]